MFNLAAREYGLAVHEAAEDFAQLVEDEGYEIDWGGDLVEQIIDHGFGCELPDSDDYFADTDSYYDDEDHMISNEGWS